jgi:hypothetical protein
MTPIPTLSNSNAELNPKLNPYPNDYRDNKRKGMSAWRLFWHDLKARAVAWKNKRRDPVPIWRSAIHEMEGRFGSSIASFFVFTR